MTPSFSALGILTRDMAASLAFYRLLGLDVPHEADDAPHAEAALPGGLRIMWDSYDTARAVDPEFTEPSGTDRVGLAFDCGSPAGVDDTYAMLTGKGYRGLHAPWDAFWGQRYATVADPDGTTVDLFAALTE
ncbi:VOC family protein [Rhodococcus sp. HNM0569]|uniref:VOC family protein n=1 Tax=Rhodococcus sp. HNM0569 TaxID=2716340 RepID=UPI001469AEC7|nr:VOC family protein [Rhodococcus sp. HNM0569]NLU85007.1 glyoxalase [Rhodococcus sp. HNM0569]